MKKYFKLLLIVVIFYQNCYTTSTVEQKNQIICIQNNEGKSFNVYPVNSSDELQSATKELSKDYRTTEGDTEISCSSFRGIDLDSEHIRSQVFAIKDNSLVVGIATLIVTPFKHLSQRGFVKLEQDSLVFKSMQETLDINDQDTFVIETGWCEIIPEYRNTKLGCAIVNQLIVPTIENLSNSLYKNKKLLIICETQGPLEAKDYRKIRAIFEKYTEGQTNVKIPMPNNFESMLGQVNPEAKFTSVMAEKFNFELLPVYNFALGPVFVKRL